MKLRPLFSLAIATSIFVCTSVMGQAPGVPAGPAAVRGGPSPTLTAAQAAAIAAMNDSLAAQTAAAANARTALLGMLQADPAAIGRAVDALGAAELALAQARAAAFERLQGGASRMNSAQVATFISQTLAGTGAAGGRGGGGRGGAAAPFPSLMDMDHGPFVSWTLGTQPVTLKGIAVKLNPEGTAVMAFDSDLLRMSTAWTGGFLTWLAPRDGLERWPTPIGTPHFSNDTGPGWSRSGSFADPRLQPYGPVPDGEGHYQGLYLQGDKVLFSYTVGDGEVLELPGFATVRNEPVFTRTFQLRQETRPLGTAESLSLRVLQVPEGDISLQKEDRPGGKTVIRLQAGNEVRLVSAQGLPPKASWRLADAHLVVDLPALLQPMRFQLSIAPFLPAGNTDFSRDFLARLDSAANLPDLTTYQRPGPARWMPVLETQAVMGTEDGPLAVDTLTLPDDNPWKSFLRLTGVDFLADGRAVVPSISGDVWIVSGIGPRMGTLRWKRYATGLNQPLGVRVVRDRIYVTGRDQITILNDRDGNGEADFYENFNNDVMAANNFHEFTMHLETDSKGNFYFTKGTFWPVPAAGVQTAHDGVMFRLSPDGKHLETIATGLRHPNGLNISPKDEIVFSDNQGNWLPTSVVHLYRPGAVYGFRPTIQQPQPPESYEKPITWLPQAVDNSPGSPIFVTNDNWGPLKGTMLLGSYGKATLSLMLTEVVDGQIQGGFLNLPDAFATGLMRGRFHRDGHLYLAGLRNWQSAGPRPGALQRVRYTGKPFYQPVAMHVKPNGIELTFGVELDRTDAADPQNYSLEQWGYRWIQAYGSPLYSVSNPETQGRDTVEIKSVRLLPDRKTVFLEIPGLKPVEQMQIAFNIKAADGKEVRNRIYNTINRVPAAAP